MANFFLREQHRFCPGIRRSGLCLAYISVFVFCKSLVRDCSK
jgi:hypothetical protein